MHYNGEYKQWGLTVKIENFDFADDLVLISNKETHIHMVTQDLANNAQPTGLEINGTKTKIMCINTKLYTINDTQFECVIRIRIHILRWQHQYTNSAFARLRSALKSNSYSKETQLILYKTVIKAIWNVEECLSLTKKA
ncbi:RNA-directed DNA polymerase from mobile element jockey [Brachionus plicatilis]|uniref:RNA-directed DNA polymerase from mobile element jockey n=1 Tax=Brachionus plicatilis TaxID=10195 RepID=A0A3M7T9Y1_BRAPC|nr:RNA-directed DNA polymerase from mobile element jockey [Brachionus plicatilis]